MRNAVFIIGLYLKCNCQADRDQVIEQNDERQEGHAKILSFFT